MSGRGLAMGFGGPRLLEIVTIVFFTAVTAVAMIVGAVGMTQTNPSRVRARIEPGG